MRDRCMLGHHVRPAPSIAPANCCSGQDVANARRDGRVVQEIIAYLGSIETAAMASDGSLQSIYARDLFWDKAVPKLKDLDDRIGPDDLRRLGLAIHTRIPRPTKAERAQFDAQHKAGFRSQKANEKPIGATNILKLRRLRPDWQRRWPRKPEVRKWFQQYLGWAEPDRATARKLVLNAEKGSLPDAAYDDDDEPGSPGSDPTF
jgi:hypothetical protein